MDFSKTKVQSAAVNHSKLDVSSTHITTGNFMQYCPVYVRHMLPGEHLKGGVNVLSRLAPVAVPTYGRCRINMRSFFVPFRTVMPNWNDFIVDTIANNVSTSSLVDDSPIISNMEMTSFFASGNLYGFGAVSRALDPTDPDDAAIIAAGSYDFLVSSTYYVLTSVGRTCFKILRSLGYNPIWGKIDDFNWSALPFLCFCKVYYDWYANSAYLNDSRYQYIARLFKFNDPSSVQSITQTDLAVMFAFVIRVCYDSGNDVYLNAWDNPVSPNNGLSSSFSMKDITLPNDVSLQIGQYVHRNYRVETNNANYNTPFGVTDVYNNNVFAQIQPSTVSDFQHVLLKSLNDYIKRNQLSGAYAVDRFLARFGFNLDSAKVDRSIFVGSQSVDVDFGDVMQTVNNAGSGNPSNLGDYAGKGIGRGQMNFDFKADEFGIFLVTYSIIPVAHFYQGYDRNCRHIKKTQFYQPEYDNLGCDVIEKGEVYVSKNDTFASSPSAYTGVYGYAPRYYEYKQMQDKVTGDFVHPSVMDGGDSWHLQREFEDSVFSGSVGNLVHSLGLTQGIDSGQFDRIFQSTDADFDKFYLVFNISAEALAPCKSLFDSYDFEEAGKSLTLDAGGAKVN